MGLLSTYVLIGFGDATWLVVKTARIFFSSVG